MPKPSTARPAPSPPSPPYDGPPATRVRAIKVGHNQYKVVEETFAGPPVSVKVLQPQTDGSGAMYWCRLRLEELLGPNRLGGTGLE